VTTKHNTKHPLRGRSRYPLRLAARGLAKSPRMEDVEVLQRRQERREEETGHPWFVAVSYRLEGTDELSPVLAEAGQRLLSDIFSAQEGEDQ